MAGRYNPSGTAGIDVAIGFDVFTTGQTFVPAPPGSEDEGTFLGAIQNFQGRFQSENLDVFDLTDPIPNLDLITRFILATDTDPARIEYEIDISGDATLESELNEFTPNPFTELTLVIEDADTDTPGFQIDVNNDGIVEFDTDTDGDDVADLNMETGDFAISDDEAESDALNDIDFIVNGPTGDFGTSSLLAGINEIRVNDVDDNGQVDGQSRGFLPEPELGKTIIQAEDLNLHVYQKEFWHASNPERTESFEVISLDDAPGDTGTATLDLDQFSITPGTYDLTLSVFDENDGQAQLDVLLDGHLLPNGSIRLDEMGTSNGLPTEDIRREFVIRGIEITSSSEEISIFGTANQQEFARVDFLVFTESDI